MDALTPSSALLADVQSGVMLRSFVIALVVVAPFGFVLRRRVLRRRAALQPESSEAESPIDDGSPTLESLVAEISHPGGPVGDHVTERNGSLTITVPRGLTLDGAAAPESLVDAIVRDAISRSGLVPTAELDRGDVRLIECRPPSR